MCIKNTVEKGDAFEKKVFDKFNEILETGDFFIDSKHCKIYKKKSYKGNSGNDIEFDISIESFMPGANKYSLLVLIECKDYNSPIQGDKIGAFSHNIKDVGGHKGIFITTSKFQKGAINIAKSENIGLAIMDNIDNLEWKVHRIGKHRYQIRQEIEDILSDEGKINKLPFVAVFKNHYYVSIIDFLSDALEQKLKSLINISFIEPNTIEDKISAIFKYKNRNNLNYYMKTEELIEFAKNQLKIKLNFDNILYDEIGYCDFKNNRIAITRTIEYNSPRWRFTLAHEIGHFILHRYLFEQHNFTMASDDEYNFTVFELSDNLSKRIEIQANMFASKLLIPDIPCKEYYNQLHRSLHLPNYPMLYLDSQKCNINNYRYITGNIAEKFGVSKEVVKCKLSEFNYFKTNSTLLRDNPILKCVMSLRSHHAVSTPANP